MSVQPPEPPSELVQELRRLRILVTLIFVIGLTVVAYFAKDLLLSIILGVMLALTLSPVVRWAERWGLAPPFTAVALVLTLGAALAVGGWFAAGPINAWMASAPEMGAQLQERLSVIFDSVQRVQQASDQVESIATPDGDGTMTVSLQQPGLLNSAASYAASIGTTAAVSLILALFILASGDMFYVKLVEAYPRMSEKKRALRIVHGVEEAISSYLFSITLINAGLGLAIALLMWLVGLPNAFIWGAAAFALNFLPYIGAVVGLALVTVYAVLMIEPIGQALLAPALYVACTSLEGQIITPTILGRRLKLNTVSVFVTVVFWGWLWGIAGALLAVPFLVIVKVICDNVAGLRTFGNFLGAADTAVAETRVADPPGART